jgi:hypothetical protein
MRTIETQATITEDGTLIISVPRDLTPGKHRVVAVIDETVSSPLDHKDPNTILTEIREEFRRQGPTKPSIAEQLELDRQARDEALRGADAVYIAVARRYSSILVSLDREQRERAATVVTARTPTDVLTDLAPPATS